MASESVEEEGNGGGGGLYLTNALNNEEIECLLSKDSKSSQQAEKYAVLKFRHYLAKRGEPFSLENLCYHVTSGNMDAKERLLAYLTTFFGDLRKADGSKYKFNALRSVRYALNRFTLKFGVDFLNDNFLKKPLHDAWVALGKRLKQEGMADVQHHDILSLDEVKKAYAWCNQNLFDPDRLQKRIFMDIYLYFGRQCRQNLPHLTKDNFGMDVDSNNIRFVYFIEQESAVTVSDVLRRGNNQLVMKERPGDAHCPVNTFLKYVSKLDPHYPRFFCHPKLNIDPAYHTVWYTKQPMGEKKMAEVMKSISSDAGLNKIYTNHCLRSTLLYLMDEGGLEAKDVSRLTGSLSHSSTKHASPPAVSLASPHTAVTWPPQSNHPRNKLLQDVSTSQSFLNPSSSSPTINSYNLNAQNSGIDTKPITVNQADLKKQQLEYLEAQMIQADAEAKKRQAEVQKRLAEAKKMAEKLAEEERLRKEAENKIYKYMVLNHEKKILETLRALWKGNQFCDATLQNECVAIPVHKILLIACCPKILETYDYIMKDTNVQVCFPRKVTADALKAFVDYLYNGSLNLSKSILESMEYLSGMLGLDDIRQLCNQFRSDMLNDSICLPERTIVNVTNSHEPPSHQSSYNDHIIPPPPIVRPSHNTTVPTSVSIQLSSNYQDVLPVTSQSNSYNLFPESHSNSILTEVNHIKLEPEVDLTAEDCTEIKQESIQSQLYGTDTNCKFTDWSTTSTVLEPHSSSSPQTTYIQRKKSDLNNFELSTTVDLSLAPLNSFQNQTAKSISCGVSPSVITISPSNSPCQSPRLTESPSDIQTLQISNTHTISNSNTNPFPVSLISVNGQSISLNDQDNKRKLYGDYDSKDDRKRTKIILN